MRNPELMLLQLMIPVSERRCDFAGAHHNLAQAKAQAFRWCMHLTRFLLCALWERNMKPRWCPVLRLVVGPDMRGTFESTKFVQLGISPLMVACHFWKLFVSLQTTFTLMATQGAQVVGAGKVPPLKRL
jgi:hypothetical protein